MPEDAYAIHGLTAAFLADKPRFGDIAAELMAFIDGAPLVIHNAEFDMRFLNAELARLEQPQLPGHLAVDTLQIARRKFPGAPASLDALCRRYNIDNSSRTLHGALLDAQLLAECYVELLGGRQQGLALAVQAASINKATFGSTAAIQRT